MGVGKISVLDSDESLWEISRMSDKKTRDKYGKEIHEWKENTDEGVRIYKATHHAGEWSFSASWKVRRSETPLWEDIEEPGEEIWEALRDILWRKYQRRRVSWKLIEEIDKKLGRESQE